MSESATLVPQSLLERIASAPADHYRVLAISGLSDDELVELSQAMKLSLPLEDMHAIRTIYAEWQREPTDVELEVIAQTWSEHCKHRIFGATIAHECDGQREEVRSLFLTYIRDVSRRIFDTKPGFVLSAFHDNAGFIKLDDELAVCLKAETHNHPSAIEPYAGANTGLGGVIRDILGAGKGAQPIGSLDVFCFGAPDTATDQIKADDVIHPLGVMRGVVRGVRDYGNRMGIPTVSGAIQFDPAYIYNPLVFCGTAGVIPIKDIEKEVRAGMRIVAAGGRTGRDGLHGATFSSAALDTESHEEDQQAVQIGNPIEEKKVADFILAAREQGLIEFVTDCGAGGFSSACGEMLETCGGVIDLDQVKLKEPGLVSWEIFISESQERMVLAVNEESMPRLQALADLYETELTELGHADGSGILKVTHHGATVCQLDCAKLHDAPVRQLTATWTKRTASIEVPLVANAGATLRSLLADFAIVSREPIIREYDHEVQGNTVLKPLGGASGDAPQDASVLRIAGSKRLLAMSVSLLPEWGKTDPFAMGAACVDECVRQLVAAGSDPERLAILDNFCVGNPHAPEELGALVETVKGIAAAAEAYGAPFVSGKDSFYNYFETKDGPVSIPVTILISGMGIVESPEHVTGSSLRHDDSLLVLVGTTAGDLGGSVYARQNGLTNATVPATDFTTAMACYRAYYQAVQEGLILSTHDVSEGGLGVALAEMAFSGKGGLEIDLCSLPIDATAGKAALLFGESPSRLILEVAPGKLERLSEIFAGLPFAALGHATPDHRQLRIEWGKEILLDEAIAELKTIWKSGLAQYY
jgi:phosphoribosylformylglycinamidine synthase